MMTIFRYRVVTDSMAPLIPVGAELILEPVSDDTVLNRFDIIVFSQNNQLICHYIWHVNQHFDKGLVITRALKDGREDLPFNRNMIKGRVTNFQMGLFQRLKLTLSQ